MTFRFLKMTKMTMKMTMMKTKKNVPGLNKNFRMMMMMMNAKALNKCFRYFRCYHYFRCFRDVLEQNRWANSAFEEWPVFAALPD
jgi:hypothetical protein